eukprot:SAG11_NODE_314_length_10874_cov_12.170302_1_plen_106_part_00
MWHRKHGHVALFLLSHSEGRLRHIQAGMHKSLCGRLQERQKLMISFNEYPNIMIKMLNACIKDASSCAQMSLCFQLSFDACSNFLAELSDASFFLQAFGSFHLAA